MRFLNGVKTLAVGLSVEALGLMVEKCGFWLGGGREKVRLPCCRVETRDRFGFGVLRGLENGFTF
jgi:hypothetical protein